MGGPLTYEELSEVISRYHIYRNIKNFIETGTYKGDTTIMSAKHFENVYTTEIVKELYEYSIKRAETERLSNIHFYLGDSTILLHDIMSHVKDQKCVFFIDAHQSGPDTGNNRQQLVPLMKELEVILTYPLGPSIFIFDDLRFFKGKEQEAWDWAKENITVSNIVKMFVEKERGSSLSTFFEMNDRLWVLTK